MVNDTCANKRRRVSVGAFLVMVSLALLTGQIGAPGVVYGNSAEPQRRPQKRQPVKARAVRAPRIDYSQFSHITHVTTGKLACDSCHKFPTKNWKDVRKGDAAFPDVAEFPDHSSCLNCHRTQFFARERPAPAICSNCHVKVTPRDNSRFLFPSLGDVADSTLKTRAVVSEFGVGFPHDKHLDTVGLSRPGWRQDASAQFVTATWRVLQKPPEQPKSCPVCHQTYNPQGDSSEEYVTKPPKTLGDNFWLKKGTFQTVPTSHAACFSCHNADSGIAPDSKDCQVCHQLLQPEQTLKVDFDPKFPVDMGVTEKTILERWSKRISAGAFRHEAGEHPSLSCLGCHNPTVMNTIDRKTLRVPIGSCGGAEGCHITAKTDDGGVLNYEIDQKKADAAFICSKCHITFGKEAVPAGHAQAISALLPKVK